MKRKKILVSMVANLGDVIFSTATAPLIKKYCPDSHITFLVRANIAPLLANHPYIDAVIPFAYQSSKDYFSTFTLAKQLKKESFDLSLCLCNRLRSDLAIWLAGISERIGPGNLWNEKKSSIYFYTDNARIKYNKDTPQYVNLQKIIKYYFQKTDDDIFLKPVLGVPDQSNCSKASKLINPKQNLLNVALCVKAENENKNWDIDKFARLMEMLGKICPINFYIVGMESDKEYADKVIAKSTYPCQNLCGKTTLLDLAAVLAGSDLLITIDNGTAHLASALNTTVVCIYTGTSPNVAPPLSKHSVCVGSNRIFEYQNLSTNMQVDISIEEVFEPVKIALAKKYKLDCFKISHDE